MAKFVTFTNANPPYEGTPILINTDHVISVYEDLTANKKVALWCKDNFWHVEETIEQNLPVEDIIRDPDLFASYNIQLEKARISAAGYCNPGPVRPPYNFIPDKMLQKCKENGRRWAEICRKY